MSNDIDMEKERKDILQDEGLKKMPFSVPEHYFEGLADRALERSSRPAPAFTRLVPLFALAASFIIMVTAGTFFLRKVTPAGFGHEELERDLYAYGELYSNVTSYEIFSGDSSESYDITDEEIVAYLIYSGAGSMAIEELAAEE